MTIGPLYIIWPFNFRPQWTLWFSSSLESFWEVFLENLWTSEEMKQDFKGLPFITPLKRRSEEKNSADYVSNKRLIVLMVLLTNHRSKDLHALGKLRNGSLHVYTAIEWDTGLQQGLLTLRSGLTFSSIILHKYILFSSLLNAYLLNQYYVPSSKLSAGKLMVNQWEVKTCPGSCPCGSERGWWERVTLSK